MTRAIAVLMFPDFQILDATGPIAAFEIAGRLTDGGYSVRAVAMRSGEVRSTSGVSMVAGRASRTESLHTLLIAGGEGSRAAATCPKTLSFVKAVAARARRVVSVCSGSYVLAGAGLLDGKAATTHWQCARDFAEKFPKVRVHADRIFIRQGKIWTSAGITAGIDLALALIAEDLGEDIARRTAQQLVVYHRRPGGQSQFSALLDLERTESRFGSLLEHARENLREPLNVEALAHRACMSPRHFARQFRAETGVSPAKAIERLRAEEARAQLESGLRSVRQVASDCGFGDAERMRRAFSRLFGLTPTALRRSSASDK